jgi:hypothetical protein
MKFPASRSLSHAVLRLAEHAESAVLLEIFNKTTLGNFLSISSSVFNLFTPNDPRHRGAGPRLDGTKFRKYFPGLVRRKTFNTRELHRGYPYPYVVNRLCWEFPCVVPSDWSAQHLQKPNNPDTLRDMKAALDITVLKQGVYNLVFHPHGWIKSEQIVELIDHAVATHGKKVKFLTFREALDRLQQNVLNGNSLQNTIAEPTAILDVNADGSLISISMTGSTNSRMESGHQKMDGVSKNRRSHYEEVSSIRHVISTTTRRHDEIVSTSRKNSRSRIRQLGFRGPSRSRKIRAS